MYCPSQWHPLTNTVLTPWKKSLKIRVCSTPLITQEHLTLTLSTPKKTLNISPTLRKMDYEHKKIRIKKTHSQHTKNFLNTLLTLYFILAWHCVVERVRLEPRTYLAENLVKVMAILSFFNQYFGNDSKVRFRRYRFLRMTKKNC